MSNAAVPVAGTVRVYPPIIGSWGIVKTPVAENLASSVPVLFCISKISSVCVVAPLTIKACSVATPAFKVEVPLHHGVNSLYPN